MKKYRTFIVLLILTLSFAAVLANIYQATAAQANTTPRRISVVFYENGSDRWVAMTLGIRQACSELGIEMSNVILADGADPERQIANIEREIADGAEGLIIAANNSEGMAEYLEVTAEHIPIVLVENGAGSTLPIVAASDEEMGRALADGVAAEETEIVVLAENMHRQNVQARYNAFVERMQKNGKKVFAWTAGGQDITKYLIHQFETQPQRAVVALDTETLENAVDASLAAIAYPRLYGLGSNEKIVYYLDRGRVVEICYGNEFNIGYIGLMQLAGQMGLDTPAVPDTIDFVLARHDNMYDPSIERLLFPIVQ